jgi:predicted dehydrogenase
VITRWGIVGPGAIAERFVDAMSLVDDGTIVAVASRSADRAAAFADRHDIAHRHACYADLEEDDEIDAAYVATPHAFHAAQTIALLEAGKHVLVEKPMALNAAQAQRMVDSAAANGRFLMEAMWSRFLPA